MYSMTKIEANIPITDPPSWAVWERSLIDLMNDSVDPLLDKYVRDDGTILWPTTENFASIDGLDDAYESFHNWPLFYMLGGDDKLIDLSLKEWNAITLQFSKYSSGHGHPMVVKEYEQGYDWMHQGEGYLFFYLLCLADPNNELNMERAKRFAGFYLNEDPDALNYDENLKIVKCAHNGSKGPAYRNFGGEPWGYADWKSYYGIPFDDVPGCKVIDDVKNPEIAAKMGKVIKERWSRGDAAPNLAITSMVTNAYLYTGNEKYKKWVKEYVGAWLDRTEKNNGTMPDNVGLSGEIGEYIDGKWYGGYYGWTWPHGWHTLGNAPVIAAENATLLFRDPSYLDFPRSQIDLLISKGIVKDGTLHVPHKYADRGWFEFGPMNPYFMSHIYCMSMEAKDMERIKTLRNYQTRDWEKVVPLFTKDSAGHESPWIAYLNGEFPNYPEEILKYNHSQIYQRLAFMRDDNQDPKTYGDYYLQVRNPITAEGLVQLTMGGTLPVYNGGLLMVRARYYDWQRKRPGLPEDVGALVEKLEDKKMALKLVNLNANQSRDIVIQAGAYGEHQFTEIGYKAQKDGHDEEKTATVDDKLIHVHLLPFSQITLDIGMKRFANDPSYSLPVFS